MPGKCRRAPPSIKHVLHCLANLFAELGPLEHMQRLRIGRRRLLVEPFSRDCRLDDSAFTPSLLSQCPTAVAANSN